MVSNGLVFHAKLCNLVLLHLWKLNPPPQPFLRFPPRLQGFLGGFFSRVDDIGITRIAPAVTAKCQHWN